MEIQKRKSQYFTNVQRNTRSKISHCGCAPVIQTYMVTQQPSPQSCFVLRIIIRHKESRTFCCALAQIK